MWCSAHTNKNVPFQFGALLANCERLRGTKRTVESSPNSFEGCSDWRDTSPQFTEKPVTTLITTDGLRGFLKQNNEIIQLNHQKKAGWEFEKNSIQCFQSHKTAKHAKNLHRIGILFTVPLVTTNQTKKPVFPQIRLLQRSQVKQPENWFLLRLSKKNIPVYA